VCNVFSLKYAICNVFSSDVQKPWYSYYESLYNFSSKKRLPLRDFTKDASAFVKLPFRFAAALAAHALRCSKDRHISNIVLLINSILSCLVDGKKRFSATGAKQACIQLLPYLHALPSAAGCHSGIASSATSLQPSPFSALLL
jgi:hypothetical protein